MAVAGRAAAYTTQPVCMHAAQPRSICAHTHAHTPRRWLQPGGKRAGLRRPFRCHRLHMSDDRGPDRLACGVGEPRPPAWTQLGCVSHN
eukprot:335207-Chlamydomonas_euryale.AAC.6